MVERIQHDAAVRNANVGTQAPAQSAQTQGVYRGQRIQIVPQVQSLLTDAIEEISIFVGERAHERKHKKTEQKGTAHQQVTQKDGANEVLKTIKDPHLKKEVQNLLAQHNSLKGKTMATLAAMVERQFGDVSDRYLALDALEEELKKQGGDESLRNSIRHIKGQLLERHGPEVRAGVNITQRALDVAQGDADRFSALRNNYRESVLAYKGLKHVYETLVEKFGTQDLHTHAQFLIKAAGDDLNAHGPSLEGEALKTIIDDLYHLETLVTLHEACKESLEHMAALSKRFATIDPSFMMNRLLHFTSEDWPDASSIRSIAQDMKAQTATEEINLLRTFRSVLEQMPDKIYHDHEQRTRLLDIVKQAQDEAIAREEDEWFE
ncbi:MAG: type III secretion system gatekeeper subunit SctW [Alphaproteobacteria bacterium GM7ARS4]|nr:type III secretion system gatekeeper subunit SctW [Alphaproteobacteria bacterium GM7ARS4]